MIGMNIKNYIQEAINEVGLQVISKAVDKTYQAVKKWEKQGHLPRTEWTGETNYAKQIARATRGKVTAKQLLSSKPKKASD